MSFVLNLNRRHKRLAQRIRCGYTWPSREPDHVHSCQTFRGHTTKVHVCKCDAQAQIKPTDDRPAN